MRLVAANAVVELRGPKFASDCRLSVEPNFHGQVVDEGANRWALTFVTTLVRVWPALEIFKFAARLRPLADATEAHGRHGLDLPFTLSRMARSEGNLCLSTLGWDGCRRWGRASRGLTPF